MSEKNFDALFRPFTHGSFKLDNRVVMAPMTRNKSPGNIPGQDVVDYYRRRAAGGTGLIITEGTTVGHPAASGYPDVPAFDGELPMQGWKRVVEAVHAEGGRIMPQLWHVGTIRRPGKCGDDSPVPGYGPSAVPHPVYRKSPEPHAMSEADIAEAIESFARAAGNAQKAGFDGVEIHGAHAYLIDQVFWSVTNQRTDKYGGATLVERARFAVELVAAVRERVGPDYPVVFRFSQWKQGDYSHKMATTPDELEAFLGPLRDAGVDIFHCSQRRYFEPEFEGSTLNLAGWAKKLSGAPTISVGSVGIDKEFINSMVGEESASAEFDELQERMARDEFDLIAVGRALIADPDWANKVRQGNVEGTTLFHPEMLKQLN